MGKEHANTRVEQDTKAAIERYADDRDLNQSEATRRLIRSGLSTEGYGVMEAEKTNAPTAVESTLSSVTVWTGLITVAALFAQLANIVLGYPADAVPWQIAALAGPTFGLSYLALRAEREIGSNRFTTALRSGLGFEGAAA